MAAADDIPRRATAEGLGTALLLATVVGSGIMAERLSGGSIALALLCNAVATGAGLVALILTMGPISGAHFNPVVTLASASCQELRWRDAAVYVVAQLVGAFAGVALAHLMFREPVFSVPTTIRAGFSQGLGEFIATFGLVAVVRSVGRRGSTLASIAVGSYITAAYWFTSSTSFANPAVTLARATSATFAGIRPADVPSFLLAQALGAVAATSTFRWLLPPQPEPPTET